MMIFSWFRNDSPGGDAVRRNPLLPNEVYRRLVRTAVERQKAFDKQSSMTQRKIA
jgi:hypothetical protein